MTSVFERDYANAYDILYASKDYEGECDLVEKIFADHSTRPTSSILDLGCGTGSHAIRLAERGYEVVGVDVAQGMLDIASTKATAERLTFELGDIRDARLDRTFDAALMMFAVLGYQTTNDDVVKALRTVRTHLVEGGLFVADFWYGPAVLTIGPSERFRRFESGDNTVLRASRGELDVNRHLCTVSFDVWTLHGDSVVDSAREQHEMRYFFPLEIDLLFRSVGIDLLAITRFPEYPQKADTSSWNALAIGRAGKDGRT